MNEENIKRAFEKVKEDMDILANEISMINQQVGEIYDLINQLNSQKFSQQIPTDAQHILNNPTDKSYSKSLKEQILAVSTRNGGVPTNKQTDIQQTNTSLFEEKSKSFEKNLDTTNKGLVHSDEREKTAELLASLDSLKKEIRLKFKRLTEQEMRVFSAIYQLESEGNLVDYRLLAEKLKLSESSIREYTSKIISKGVPLSKVKINNKKIVLKLLDSIKQIASLDTIIKLREI